MLRNLVIAAAWSILVGSVSVVYSQLTAEAHHASTADSAQTSDETSKLPEIEFVGSSSFRSGSVIQPVWGHVSFEGDYFGGDEYNIGYTAGTWSFRGEHWKLAPGLGVNFGNNGYRTMPAASLRWEYEHEWLVTEGLLLQGFLPTQFRSEESEDLQQVAPFISDGNHISVRWQRLTAGGAWEHIHFREGQEWKGGLRVAYRVLPPLSFTIFVLGPGTEVRGGILFRPEEKNKDH